MPTTGLQNSRLTLKDAVWFVSLMVTISVGAWRMSARDAQFNARLDAIELVALENKQLMIDHNPVLTDYKLQQIDEKIDKIMVKLDIN